MSKSIIDDIVSDIVDAALAAAVGSKGAGQEEAEAATPENGQVRDTICMPFPHLKPLCFVIICNSLPGVAHTVRNLLCYYIILCKSFIY